MEALVPRIMPGLRKAERHTFHTHEAGRGADQYERWRCDRHTRRIWGLKQGVIGSLHEKALTDIAEVAIANITTFEKTGCAMPRPLSRRSHARGVPTGRS